MRLSTTIIGVLLLISLIGNYYLYTRLEQSHPNTVMKLVKKYPLMSARALNPSYPNELIVNFLPLRSNIQKTS